MYETSFTVLSVTGKNTSNGKTVYEIAGSDGVKYQTWDGNTAAKAQGLQGQVVVARVEQKQNGKWTNYNVEDIGLPGTLAPSAAPIATAPVVVPPQNPAVAAIPMQQTLDPLTKEKHIIRQNVLGTAFSFVAALYTGAGPEALDEATERAGELAKRLYGKVMADATPAPQAAPVPTTPAEVAAAVPGVEVGTENIAQPAPTPEW